MEVEASSFLLNVIQERNSRESAALFQIGNKTTSGFCDPILQLILLKDL